MPRLPKVVGRRPSMTFAIRAYDDTDAALKLILLVNEEAMIGVTGASCVVRVRP